MYKSIQFKELIPIIGEEAARNVINEFPYCTFYIPCKYPEYDIPERNELIRNLRRSGASYDDLAIEFQLSKGQIFKIMAEK